MAQPGFLQGGGQNFLNNPAQVQGQNSQNLVAIGILRTLLSRRWGVRAAFKQSLKKFNAIANIKNFALTQMHATHSLIQTDW